MKRWVFGVIVLGLVCSGLLAQNASAASLQLRPLTVKTTLKKNENQKGYLDVSNTDAQSVTLVAKVQGFHQISNEGELEFYNDPVLKAGIALDVDEFIVGPHQTMRVYYALIGSKLPEGDISSAIFFQTKPEASAGVAVSARLGTLLSITNGAPGMRQAEIVQVSAPFFQIGTTITGSYQIKNTSDPEKGGGFFPDVSLALKPLNQTVKVQSSLVFPGVQRENAVSISTNRIGLYELTASYAGTAKSVWVFIISPIWLAGLLLIGITGVVAFMLWRRRTPRTHHNSRHRRFKT